MEIIPTCVTFTEFNILEKAQAYIFNAVQLIKKAVQRLLKYLIKSKSRERAWAAHCCHWAVLSTNEESALPNLPVVSVRVRDVTEREQLWSVKKFRVITSNNSETTWPALAQQMQGLFLLSVARWTAVQHRLGAPGSTAVGWLWKNSQDN